MPTYQRKQIPYNPAEVLPFSNRYALVAEQDQPINSNQLDGDFNYIIDSLNDLWTITQGIAVGVLPGSSSPLNVNKFPVTDGAGTISWTNITSGYFSAQCITTLALQNGCVTNPKIGNGAVGNENIQAGAIQNNNIEDDKISFDKIAAVNNAHFQLFFNTQADSTLSGSKIQAGSLPATSIVPNSITGSQVAPGVIVPIGTILDWAGSGNAPVGYLKAVGGTYSRATYSLLFSVIGTTYGSGDGVTTFGIPDLRGRTIFGIDPSSGQPTGGRIINNAPSIGGSGGEEMHTLITSEMPSHVHNLNPDHTPYFSANTGSGTYYGSIPVLGISTLPAGGDQAHNNMPPYMLIQKIIYAGV